MNPFFKGPRQLLTPGAIELVTSDFSFSLVLRPLSEYLTWVSAVTLFSPGVYVSLIPSENEALYSSFR